MLCVLELMVLTQNHCIVSKVYSADQLRGLDKYVRNGSLFISGDVTAQMLSKPLQKCLSF